MRFGSVVLAGIAGLSLALGPGESRAAARPFTGTLVIQIATLTPIIIPGLGTAVVNGSSGGGHLTSLQVPADAFVSNYVLPVTDPAAAPIKGIQASLANAVGSFSGSGGSGTFGGVMPIEGFSKVCLFGPCSAAVANISVPLSVAGVGGSAAVTAAVNLTIVGAPRA